jgi:hypothetical protein
MKQYMPNGDVADGNHVHACTHAVFAKLRPVLKPCSDKFIWTHFLKWAANRLAPSAARPGGCPAPSSDESNP